jgi:farnesyl-diphosphate farnesyltransferase
MCRAHLFPEAPLDEAFLLTNGVRFGKGLQLVNILRDLPRDLRQGRCYLPLERLTAERLTPTDLLGPNNESRFRPLYETYLKQTESHLAAGWAYTNALPRASVRIRLACAWPILIGIRTIKKLRKENMLDPLHRIKISRSEVRALIVRSVLNYPFQATWERQFARAK